MPARPSVLLAALAYASLACATPTTDREPLSEPELGENATVGERLPTAPAQLGFGPSTELLDVADQLAGYDRLLALRGVAPLRSEPIAHARELRIWVRVFATDLLVRLAETPRGVEGELIYFAPSPGWIADVVADGGCVVPLPPLAEPAPIRSCVSPNALDYAVLRDQLAAAQVWSLPFHTPPRPNRTHPTWIVVEAREGDRYRAWASHPAGKFDAAPAVAAIVDLIVTTWEADGQLGS